MREYFIRAWNDTDEIEIGPFDSEESATDALDENQLNSDGWSCWEIIATDENEDETIILDSMG